MISPELFERIVLATLVALFIGGAGLTGLLVALSGRWYAGAALWAAATVVTWLSNDDLGWFIGMSGVTVIPVTLVAYWVARKQQRQVLTNRIRYTFLILPALAALFLYDGFN